MELLDGIVDGPDIRERFQDGNDPCCFTEVSILRVRFQGPFHGQERFRSMHQKGIELRLFLAAFILQPAANLIHGHVQAFYDVEEVNAGCGIGKAVLSDGNIAVCHITAEETDPLAFRKRGLE